MPDSMITPLARDPNLSQRVRLQLTNDQMLALRNTPVTLVEAQNGYYIVVEEVYVEFFNTLAYTESTDNLLVEYANGTAQVETATVAETVDGVLVAGNATVTVTAAAMANSPKAVSVALATNDTAVQAAGKIRTALAADADVGAFFTISGATDKVIATARVAVANDGTMNIAIADGTCVGLAAAATSANTTAGAVGKSILTVEATGLVDTQSSAVAAHQVPAYTSTYLPPAGSAVRIRNSGDGEFGGGSSSNSPVFVVVYRTEQSLGA